MLDAARDPLGKRTWNGILFLLERLNQVYERENVAMVHAAFKEKFDELLKEHSLHRFPSCTYYEVGTAR